MNDRGNEILTSIIFIIHSISSTLLTSLHMTVQLRINTDTSSSTLEIPEVSVIRPNNGKIQLSLKRPISSTLNDKDYVTIMITPDYNVEVINKGYGILVNRALIERVSL